MKFSQWLLMTLLSAGGIGIAHAEALKPFVLAESVTGDASAIVAKTKAKLQANGFQIVGAYQPYPQATVICATNAELREVAAKTRESNGGFGVAQRISVTTVGDKVEVAYANPQYVGVAYGLGKLPRTTAALKAALGAQFDFGAEGIEEAKLKPGEYRYSFGMPYFYHTDLFASYPSYEQAVAAVEKGLADKRGGTVKVYRVDLPEEVSVFGIGIVTGDGIDSGAKDTDTEIMRIIDAKTPRSTAYLPYELMVKNGQVISLRARYRIAVNFPDLKMVGNNSFGKIMSAPNGILTALTAVANDAASVAAPSSQP